MTGTSSIARFNLGQTRYRLLAPLASGGMSAVYRAMDTALDREVALKLFAARADDPEQLRAQQREAQLLASFRHHSLVTLFDAGVDFEPDGAPRMFLVMERVEGTDLRVRLRGGPVPPLHVAHIGFDLADALAYLHERGVTHRDIKPANLLLVERSESRRPRVKLADFGIAQIAGDRPDAAEGTTGTAAYLSPEQAAGDPIGPPSDVYSTGLVLLEALTGRVAFPGSIIESAMARLDRSPEIPAVLPAHWRDLLTRMTAMRPADRPTAAEVAVGFRQILIDEITADEQPDPASAVSRTAAVRRYDLLADGRDAALDRICTLAERLLGADGAVVAVHDDDRALVRARSGRLADGLQRYVPGVLEADAGAVTDVRDAAADAVPLLAAAATGTRGYAGAPARTHDGHAVAVLGVLFAEPREVSDDERATLQDLADAIVHEAEMRRAVRRLLQPALEARR